MSAQHEVIHLLQEILGQLRILNSNHTNKLCDIEERLRLISLGHAELPKPEKKPRRPRKDPDADPEA